ncbi:DoxX family protein [Actinoplanes sp. NPDC023801]|uniref:DoxX family protein n=1 Tax=Actinoplanes sp. NPDC023801 TaxID=3154595 RepID=UPI0033E3134D
MTTFEGATVDGTRTARTSSYPWAQSGLLIVRLIIGFTFLAHGIQNMVGMFGWDVTRFAGYLGEKGYQSTSLLSGSVMVIELVVGVTLLLGLYTPIAASLAAGVMLNATFIKLGAGFFMPTGFEWELAVLSGALVLMLAGPGSFALDHKLLSAPATVRLTRIGLGVAAVMLLFVVLAFR